MTEDINLVVIDAKEYARQITLQVETRVVNLRWVKSRLWLAIQVCRIAAWLGGIGLEINQEVGVLLTNLEQEEE